MKVKVKIGNEEIELTLQQKLMAENFITKELFGNGVQSYIKAYKPDQTQKNWYQTAKSSASRILTNVNFCAYVSHLLESHGFNDQFIDKQLLFLITQNADFTAKLGAIREYNKIKSRITESVKVERKYNIRGYKIYDPSGKEVKTENKNN